MRVTELIIDGFKSYAVRTVITGWDESFNAVTGLNGSGKSNILDAICFVLGITNMSTVRAQNLQDLIYKRGQAGVTKASVTIVFDNRDKKRSPIGFEEYATISVTRQIVLGGTTKYLINGHRAQQQTVQNLFQSVQLNINNPNFLIMQGRITKVLNMKPAEILAMIEEAAGTRMFEDRKEKALKTMAKKDLKLQEITELLADEIEPKLEKLRQEKRAFLDFQQTQSGGSGGSLRKKINPKVMNMIDSVEKKEMSLKHMMKTVLKDKHKIEETIATLDEYKRKALQETWEKVNGDFGQIFNELLPGSFAKLEPPEGKDLTDGLEVKVRLGKVWKQSLTELSGGQRSLIALSLIMALLQFKPAPMYILDEVDAALDLSHTQNIGRLIKTRFKGSQFIVVSLKDGMFQNANRIFRVRFSEGTSVVQALTPADLK
uniref:Structural maintenance of chromosomes protein,Structural maintenance of chromosomes protein n=1 Tax=Thermochaetoides thermophila TaxID=209285 RepID=UPI0011329F56